MNNISFKSGYRTVPPKDFFKFAGAFGEQNYVGVPWTVKQSVFSSKAYTKNVMDCVVIGITDGLNVLLMHICPTKSENANFADISKYIQNTIEFMNKNCLQGFVMGSKNTPESKTLFDNVINFLDKLKIPTSYFKGGNCENHVAYWSATDNWIISNAKIKPFTSTKDNLKKTFDEIKISAFDEII